MWTQISMLKVETLPGSSGQTFAYASHRKPSHQPTAGSKLSSFQSSLSSCRQNPWYCLLAILFLFPRPPFGSIHRGNRCVVNSARGGVGIAQMSSMSVMVGIRLERSFCDWLKDPSAVRAAAGRRNFKKVVTDESLLGRIHCCISGGIWGSGGLLAIFVVKRGQVAIYNFSLRLHSFLSGHLNV